MSSKIPDHEIYLFKNHQRSTYWPLIQRKQNKNKMQLAKSPKINEYTLLDLLGEGAFAKVYLAEGPLNKKYALKMVKVNNQNKDKIREEGIILASMKHKNLLWAREFFFYDKEQYFIIITDYCPDGSLDLKIGNLPSERIIKIMGGIAEGLRFLHLQKNIMHRDLKPENILLDGDTPKIGDLGLSRVLENELSTTLVGTQSYMAPEMLEEEYGIQIDLWALGVIFLELLIGKRLWEILKGEKILAKRESFPKAELLEMIQIQRYRKMVSRMLVRNPSQRADIEQVCTYFQSIPLMNISKSSKYSRSSLNISLQIVKETYSKFNDYLFCKYTKQFIKQLIEKNMVEVEGEARNNSKMAQFLLGKMYQEGFGMHVCLNKAKQWFLKASAQEEPHSYYELYLLAESSHQKHQLLQYGKLLSQVRCELIISESYIEGSHDFSKDILQAYDLAEDLCARKYPKAFLLMGKLQNSAEQEITYYKKGVEMCSLECQLALLLKYYHIKKYHDSIAVALSFQQKQEITLIERLTALQTMGKCYLKLKEEERAIEAYKRCIDLDPGDLEKDYRGKLGSLYEEWGNIDMAIQYYYDAIYMMIPKRQKKQFFQQRLKKICEKLYLMLAETQRYQDAFLITELSASLGFPFGKADYGYLIYLGQGVVQNQEAGIALLEKEAKKGNTQAEEYLNQIRDSSQKQ